MLLLLLLLSLCFFFFFFNDTATTEIYTLSLHDALPIFLRTRSPEPNHAAHRRRQQRHHVRLRQGDRKSTRLNSSHQIISYAVFCLKKKKDEIHTPVYRPSISSVRLGFVPTRILTLDRTT